MLLFESACVLSYPGIELWRAPLGPLTPQGVSMGLAVSGNQRPAVGKAAWQRYDVNLRGQEKLCSGFVNHFLCWFPHAGVWITQLSDRRFLPCVVCLGGVLVPSLSVARVCPAIRV